MTYQDLGLRVLRIGEEAIIDLHTFNLKGKANQNLRNYINRSTKAEYQINEITIDLMRHRTQVESGTMDFLFISMFQHCQQLGYDGFNLGLSALSGVGEKLNSPRLERALHYLYEHLNQFYNFKDLHTYKEKFHPHWEPRYLIYPGLVALPEVVVALIRADSGDRLLDYFKPSA
jgi:phosphatidylglycerol lysyltransferase